MNGERGPEAEGPPPTPRATYRLQFGAEFDFGAACRIVPYLAKLGVSHVYASPLLAARPGSAHGYDIVDHGRLNPELGGEDGFDALVRRLHAHGMGLVMDFVPNHMGIGADNPWWADVLEWGPDSPYASYFDIDWRPIEPSLSRKVLLPVLADHYGVVLERGELEVRIDGPEGTFAVWYGEARFPLSPREYPRILRASADCLGDAESPLGHLAESFEAALSSSRRAREREARRERVASLKRELARTLDDERGGSRPAVEERLRELNGGEGVPGSFDELHRILERQAYRLAFWRVAAHEINYRRFFDISDLAGLRMEDPALFEESHRLVRRLLAEGKIQGLRLDHVDGLRNPRAYLDRLRELGREEGVRPYLVVEKILADHEALRPDWTTDGTTGYEFMVNVTRLQVDPRGERDLTRAYERFVGREIAFDEVVVEAKRLIMRDILASELAVIASGFNRIAKQNRKTRDYTLTGLRHALSDVVAHFPSYRSYVTEEGASPEDRREIDRAIGRARRHTRQPDTSIYDFIRDVLTLDLAHGAGRDGYRRGNVVDVALRFQQYTGPVMAKAVEDTAFYRYHRLVALNEVGGEPDHFSLPLTKFHEGNLRRLEEHPSSMVATATHDHKRGEDVRARLAVLSELPREWGRRARRWSRMNRRARRKPEGRPAPSANDEYLLYQTLVGTWPAGTGASAGGSLEELRDRIDAYMAKAIREAKMRTSWGAPDAAYERAVSDFVHQVLDPERSGGFLEEVAEFVDQVAPAGAVNGLAQVLLKLTVPGVPDVYQGTERWDLSLVDPDNRRPVDYEERSACVEEAPSTPGSWDPLLAAWPDGRIKQKILGHLLEFRRRHPTLFAHGSYLPVEASGEHPDRVVAFAREEGDALLVAVAPRFPRLLLADTGLAVTEGWGETALAVGELAAGRPFRNLFTGREVEVPPGGRLPLASILDPLPVAAFERAGGSAHGG